MAREQCGNYLPSGMCLDVNLDSGAIAPLSKCLVADRQQCAFFERFVLLLAVSHKGSRRKPWIQRGMAGARATYMRRHGLTETGKRPRQSAPEGTQEGTQEGKGGANGAKSEGKDAVAAEGGGK